MKKQETIWPEGCNHQEPLCFGGKLRSHSSSEKNESLTQNPTHLQRLETHLRPYLLVTVWLKWWWVNGNGLEVQVVGKMTPHPSFLQLKLRLLDQMMDPSLQICERL